MPFLVSERTNYSLRTASNYSVFCKPHWDLFSLIPTGMISVLTYIVSNLLVLLTKLYFPFTMYLVITLLMNILLLIDLMQFSTLVYVLTRFDTACFWGFYNETVKHFFLECPLYSAPRTNLLSSAARIFSDRWSSMSEAQIVSIFLFASQLLSPKQNNNFSFFFHFQSFISESKRFYKYLSVYFPPVSIA